MPALLVSDSEPQFTSCLWHILISALGCKHSLSMAFHPEMDDLSEGIKRSRFCAAIF